MEGFIRWALIGYVPQWSGDKNVRVFGWMGEIWRDTGAWRHPDSEAKLGWVVNFGVP